METLCVPRVARAGDAVAGVQLRVALMGEGDGRSNALVHVKCFNPTTGLKATDRRRQ